MKEHIKPEVGDVWIYAEDNKKYLIVEQDRKEDVFFGWLDGILGLSEDFEKTWFRKDKFPQVATYLGKSKANINELFEVENNGRCIEDNTPHVESTVLFKDLEVQDE